MRGEKPRSRGRIGLIEVQSPKSRSRSKTPRVREMPDLYARPSFFQGMGSVLDVFGVFREHGVAGDPEQADARALYSDFQAVGVDLAKAMSRYESAQKGRSPQACSKT